MNTTYSVLIYSKYSPLSKELFDKINKSPISFSYLQLLCVDNKKIRDRVKENNQLNIRGLPTILLVFPDGRVEKYEGSIAIDWIDQIINNFIEQQPKVNQDEEEKISEEQNWVKQEAIQQKKYNLDKERAKKEEQRIKEENKKKYEDRLHKKQNPDQPNQRRRTKEDTTTSIEDLPELDEDNDHVFADRYEILNL